MRCSRRRLDVEDSGCTWMGACVSDPRPTARRRVRSDGIVVAVTGGCPPHFGGFGSALSIFGVIDALF